MIKISEAEYEVMKILWEKKETTSCEIILELSNKNWTDNTIRTLINRLVDKKAIGIAGKKGRTYTYVPLIDENKYKVYVTKKYVEQMYNGSYVDFILDCIKDDKKAEREFLDLLKILKSNTYF